MRDCSNVCVVSVLVKKLVNTKPQQNVKKIGRIDERKDNYDYIRWQSKISRMEDEAYNVHDDTTLDNTIQNKNIPFRDHPLHKTPIKRELSFHLDDNVTYAFKKDQAVIELMNPEHQQRAEIRKVLDEESRQKSVIKHKPAPEGTKPKRGALKKSSPVSSQLISGQQKPQEQKR